MTTLISTIEALQDAGVNAEQILLVVVRLEKERLQREELTEKDKRQKAAERKRKQRNSVTECHTMSHDVTRCHSDTPSPSFLPLDGFSPHPFSLKPNQTPPTPKENPPKGGQKKSPSPSFLGEQRRKPLEYSPEFEEIWELYPKNGASKQESYKSYQKVINNGTSGDEIRRGIEKYRKYAERTATPIAHATTWINQQRWTVEYDAIGGNAGGFKQAGNGGGWLAEGQRLVEHYTAEAERERQAELSKATGSDSANGKPLWIETGGFTGDS